MSGPSPDVGVQVGVVEPGNYDSEICRNAAKRLGITHEKIADQEDAEITIRKQSEQLVQLNEGRRYTYDRNALVKMLDEALAQARPKTR